MHIKENSVYQKPFALKEKMKSEMILSSEYFLFEFATLKYNLENAIFLMILPKYNFTKSIASTLVQLIQFKINLPSYTAN